MRAGSSRHRRSGRLFPRAGCSGHNHRMLWCRMGDVRHVVRYTGNQPQRKNPEATHQSSACKHCREPRENDRCHDRCDDVPRILKRCLYGHVFVSAYLAGIIFLQLILNLAKNSSDSYSFSDISTADFKREIKNTKIGKEDLEATRKAYEENKNS